MHQQQVTFLSEKFMLLTMPVTCYPTNICSISGDGEEDEVEGETESMASSQQHEQQELESRGERSHLIVWQVEVQD
jgi:hypothetical protein